MGGNENRYRSRNNRGKKSKSYTEGVAMRNGEDAGHRGTATRREEGSSRNTNSWRTDNRNTDSRSRDGRHNEQISRRHEEFVPIPRMPAPACGVCGQPVIDLTSAFSVGTDITVPVHFECVLKKLEEQEHLGHNERVIYIGQGKFAVAYYENPSDQKRFKILRTIQWEESQTERSEWRETLSGYYSQIK